MYINAGQIYHRNRQINFCIQVRDGFLQYILICVRCRSREFLAAMGLADEFTVEMANYITKLDMSESLIKSMTEQNAFVTKLPDGVHFRFHHMMKECAERTFAKLPMEKQLTYRNRYGDWYTEHEQYIHALAAYKQSGNYDAILDVVQADAGILLATQNPDQAIATLDQCPKEILDRHPLRFS